MKWISQAALGFLAALLSLTLLLGAFSLAFIENNALVAWLPTAPPTSTPTPTATVTPVNTPVPGQPTFTPSPTLAPSPTYTLVPPTNCPPPAGWIPIRVLPGDTLGTLAHEYDISPDQLARANCLEVPTLAPDSVLYVPPRLNTLTPTHYPTRTPIPCGPPAGWVRYIVKPGDTLYSLGLAYGVTVRQLQVANCLGYSTNIRAGESLWVPNVPTRTPTPSPTLTPTPVTPSATPVPPTATHTPTPVTPSPTHTPVTPSPTLTPVPPTATPVTPDPTETPVTPDPTQTPITPEPPEDTPGAPGTPDPGESAP
jgi:LysM repeat protein